MRRIFCETLGTELHLPDKLERIISFSPAVTETLFLLGAGEKIAGVSAFCARPPEARRKKVLGSYNTVEKRVLEEIKPDIIFTTTGYQRDFAMGLGKDFPVYAVELPVSVPGIIDMVIKVGLITARIGEATELSRRLEEVLSELKPLHGKRTVYLEIDFNGPVSFGAYSYITDGLRQLGVESIFGNEPCEWLTPDLEVVRQSDPEAIVYEAKMFSHFGSKEFGELIRKRGWAGLRAVKGNLAFLAPGPLDFFAHHGPSFITTAMPWLRNCLEAVHS